MIGKNYSDFDETMRFNNELLNDAVDMNRDSKNNDSDIKTLS